MPRGQTKSNRYLTWLNSYKSYKTLHGFELCVLAMFGYYDTLYTGPFQI